MKRTLSVIIITKNESDRIERCLQSVSNLADEIIVFDSGSDDETVEIVRKYTDKVWETDWPGYGPQKQRALEKASCDWVLSIDADEELDFELANSILAILDQDDIAETAFRLRWGTIFLGQRMNYGRSARAPKRLFRRKGAKFTNSLVHEHIQTKGKISTIKSGYLVHYSTRDFYHLMEKTRKYSWLTSKKYFDKNKPSFGIPFALVRSLFTFIQIFIFRLGFLDGSRGLILAVVFAQSTFNKYAGLWSLEQENQNPK